MHEIVLNNPCHTTLQRIQIPASLEATSNPQRYTPDSARNDAPHHCRFSQYLIRRTRRSPRNLPPEDKNPTTAPPRPNKPRHVTLENRSPDQISLSAPTAEISSPRTRIALPAPSIPREFPNPGHSPTRETRDSANGWLSRLSCRCVVLCSAACSAQEDRRERRGASRRAGR